MLKIKGKIFMKSIVMSTIMTRAWAIKRLDNLSNLSQCMRKAWSDFKASIVEARATSKATVKSWFILKSLTPQEVQAVSIGFNTGSIETKTEKAVLVRFDTACNSIRLWTPKKCLKEV